MSDLINNVLWSVKKSEGERERERDNVSHLVINVLWPVKTVEREIGE